MSPRRGSAKALWSAGITMFAGVLLLCAGVFGFLQGLAAVLNNNYYVATPNYAFDIDISAWGWIHLILGVAAAVVAVLILAGNAWGKTFGILLAGLSIVANFLTIPYNPIASTVIIGLDVLVIWAFLVYDPERV